MSGVVTLRDRVRACAAATPGAPAVLSPDARLTYAELDARADALAGALVASGVRAGERVLIALPTVPGAVVVTLAVQAVGALPVEVNRDAGRPMLEAAFAATRPRAVFVTGRDARAWGEIWRDAPPSTVIVSHAGPVDERIARALGVTQAFALRDDGTVVGLPDGDAPRPPLDADPASPALVLFTSGSTGGPRGVIHTHRNIEANTTSIVEYLGITARERAMCVLPFAYTFGRSIVQTHLWTGASVFLDPRFMYPGVVMDALRAEGCTSFSGVPLTFEHLRRHVGPDALHAPSLATITQAGGGAPTELVTWMRETFAPARVVVMYGQTEATARLSYLPPERSVEKLGSIGRAIPGVTLEVHDEQGRALAAGEEGMLVARGDNITPGYLDAPEDTRAILKDGWLVTGDLAKKDDDGFFFITGRVKDIVKIGGRRVNPAELEPLLRRQRGVRAVAVIDVPADHDRALVAVVVKDDPPPDGEPVTEGALLRAVRADVPAWLVPKRVLFVDALPENANGKLDKGALKARFHDVLNDVNP